MKDVVVGRVDLRRTDLRVARERRRVAGRVALARFVPAGEVRQLGQQDRGLQTNPAGCWSPLPRGGTAGTRRAAGGGRSRSASASSWVTISPASPQAPRFLVGKKERVPTAPSSPDMRQVAIDLAARPDGLCAVLDDRQPVAGGDGTDLLHGGHLAEEMNDHDRPGSRGDGGLDGRRARC